MKEFRSKQSGRYIFNEDIHNLQELALSSVEMFKDSGIDFVISGCEITITESGGVSTVSVSSGYVFLDNKIRMVAAFTGTTSSLNHIGIYATTPVAPQITYVGGDTDYQYNDFAAEVRINDENVGGAACLLAMAVNSNYVFPNLHTAYFKHYALINNGVLDTYAYAHILNLLVDEGNFVTLKIGNVPASSLFVLKGSDVMNDGATLTFNDGQNSTIIGGGSITTSGVIAAHEINADIVNADAFVVNGGTASQFLKADGSLDGTEYVTADALDRFLPLTGGVVSGSLKIVTNLSVDGNATVAGSCTIANNLKVLDTIASVNATLTGLLQTLGFKASNAEITNDLTVGNMAVSGTAEIGGTLTTTSTASIGGDTIVSGDITATKFIKSGGTTSQFLKADGSVDTNVYATTASLSAYVTTTNLSNILAEYLPLSGGSLSADGGNYYTSLSAYGITLGRFNSSASIALGNNAVTIDGNGNNFSVQASASTFSGSVTATSFIKSGGTSNQFLKADGSIDANTYLTSSDLTNYATASDLANYLPITGGSLQYNDYELILAGYGITLKHIEGQATFALTGVDRYLGITANKMVVNCGASFGGAMSIGGDLTMNSHKIIFDAVDNYIDATTSYGMFLSHHYYTFHFTDGTNDVGKLFAAEYNQSSDIRLKENVEDIHLSVEDIANMPMVRYNFINDIKKESRVGTIAQNWEGLLPEVVSKSQNGMLSMNYSDAAIVCAISLAKEIVALKREVARLTQ